jgi:hypothetical protein
VQLFTHSNTGARFAGAWAYTDDDDDDDDALAKAMAAVTVATVNIVQHINGLAGWFANL